MSLSTRISLSLVAVVAAFALLNGWAVQELFTERFTTLEQESHHADLMRARHALEGEVEQLDELTQSLGCLPTFQLVVQGHQADLDAGFQAALDLDALILLGPADNGEQRPVLHAGFAIREGTGPLDLREFPRGAWSPRHPLLTAASEGRRAGIQRTDHGPLLVATTQVTSTEAMLVTGRLLDATRIRSLSDRIGVPLELHQLGPGHELPPQVEPWVDRTTGSVAPTLADHGEQVLGLSTLNDLQEQPDLLVAVTLPRDITQEGWTATAFGWTSSVIGALLLVLVLQRLLRAQVLGPLQALASHAEEVGRTEDLGRRISLDREDELGRLGRELDRMLEKLAEARRAVVDAARSAGKSEVATGILHNVGNVLAGIRVSSAAAESAVADLPTADLTALRDTLEAQSDDLATFLREDPRGQHALPFLGAVTERHRSAEAALRQELRDLQRGIEHVAELVRGQQRFARPGGLVESLEASALVHEALELAEDSSLPGERTTVEVTIEPGTLVQADRHRALEILVNLLRNARQAQTVEGEPSFIRVTARGDGDWISFLVEDEGVGIAAEDLERIFAPGYTTKAEGNGYGLHTAANSAREMGGRLTAGSEGVGQGACFELRLPRTSTKPVGSQEMSKEQVA